MVGTRRDFFKLAGAAALAAAGTGKMAAESGSAAATQSAIGHFDLVVYGSTPSGVVAAVAAAREGLRVVLLSQGHHVGGMVSGGLSHTDRGDAGTIGGIAREFFERAGQHYNERIEWDFEPHVAEQVFDGLLREARVTVVSNARLRELRGVTKSGSRIRTIATEDGKTYSASTFIDASYEGDLMAQAGVSFTVGREAASQYNESWAGVLTTNRHQDWDHQFPIRVSPYAPGGSLLPLVSSAPKGKFGQGDKKLPAYCYRVTFTDDRSNQVPFSKPEGYDPRQYELLTRYLVDRQAQGYKFRMADMVMADSIRNGKFDVNNHGPISTDFINESWDYPTASYKRREEIEHRHYLYEAGFFYYLAQDPHVPALLQNEFNLFGLAADEFTDNHHWPWQLYIREARRMVGEFVVTQNVVLAHQPMHDSIGMGSYNMDSHNVQRIPTPDGAVENEGDFWLPVNAPWEIPYRCITPKRSEAENLLVPVCSSLSHVAYGTFREEPALMIAGQAAGTAAVLAARKKLAIQDVPMPELQARLTAAHAILHWSGFSLPHSGDALDSNTICPNPSGVH